MALPLSIALRVGGVVQTLMPWGTTPTGPTGTLKV